MKTYDKHIALAWVGVAWKGKLQQGMVAADEEVLENLIDDSFFGIAEEMKKNPDDWEIVPLTIIVPVISEKK